MIRKGFLKHVQELSLSTSTEYNPAGQVIKTINRQGLISTYTYLNGNNTGSNLRGMSVEVTLPTGGVVKIETNCDGSRNAVTGTAIVPEYYSYESAQSAPCRAQGRA